MSKHTIAIINNTGAPQNYALFNQTPKVDGKIQGQLWSNVSQTVNAVPDMEEASFELYLQYYGVAGSFDATPSNGTPVTVDQTKSVTLGSKKEDGSTSPGSALHATIKDSGLRFDSERQPSCAPHGAFELSTSSDFTSETANEQNLMIGLGCGTSQASPLACFVPQPNTKYAVHPSRTFFIAFGDFVAGQLIEGQRLAMKCEIDFEKTPGKAVQIMHTPHGDLELQF